MKILIANLALKGKKLPDGRYFPQFSTVFPNFQRGDPVYTVAARPGVCGACAGYAVFNEDHVFPLPEGVSFSQGACLGLAYFTAYRALVTR